MGCSWDESSEGYGLTAGRVTDDLTGLVTPTQIGAFIENLLEDYDYVLLDAPAVLATADVAQ